MRSVFALVAVFALGGCAELQPGTSREPDVIAKFGTPVETRQLADGGRVLDYPREPMGAQNWRVTLNADGTVRSVEQLLDNPHFALLQPGMSEQDVVRELGPPSEKKGFPNLGEEELSWLYWEPNYRQYFNAHFDTVGLLTRTSRTPDPLWNINIPSRR